MVQTTRISKRSALASPYAQLSDDELARVFNKTKAKYRTLMMLMKVRKQEALNEAPPVQDEQPEQEHLNVAQPIEAIQPDNIQQETPDTDSQEQDIAENQQEILNVDDLATLEEPTPPNDEADEIQQPEINTSLNSRPNEVINNIQHPVINNSDECSDCPVCMEHLQHGFATCPNNHRVCFSCFMNDLVKTCPICRYDYHKPAVNHNNEALRYKIEELNEDIELLRDENAELMEERERLLEELHDLRYPPARRRRLARAV